MGTIELVWEIGLGQTRARDQAWQLLALCGTSGVVRKPWSFALCRSGRQPDKERTEYDAHLYALDLGPAEALSATMVLDAALAPLRCGVRVMHTCGS